MVSRAQFTIEEARRVGAEIGIDWAAAAFAVDQLRRGMEVELEHGRRDSTTNVTDDDRHLTAKIALAHLDELADYYVRLERMEQETSRT